MPGAHEKRHVAIQLLLLPSNHVHAYHVSNGCQCVCGCNHGCTPHNAGVHRFEPDPEDLFVANGVTTINEMLAFCLCDPGDGILLASPFYPGFGLDFCLRAQATLLPVREAPATASGASEESGTELGGPLCVESLEIEYQKAIAEGVHPRLLCLCSPSNPTGRVYSADTLTEILQWALQKEDLHVYVDEIYALTTFVGETFTSVRTLPLLPHDRVHTGHGLAKDFGLSGLKTGWLYTTNEDMKSVLRQLLRFGVTSSLNQCAIASLLEDHELTLSYLQKVRQELTDARDFTKRSLEEISVKTVPSQAGLFLWVDMREHIQAIQHVKGLSSLADAELLLVEHLIEKEKLILLSSRACQAVEPGFFRLTFAFHDAEVLISEGVCRIGRALDTLKCPPI